MFSLWLYPVNGDEDALSSQTSLKGGVVRCPVILPRVTFQSSPHSRLDGSRYIGHFSSTELTTRWGCFQLLRSKVSQLPSGLFQLDLLPLPDPAFAFPSTAISSHRLFLIKQSVRVCLLQNPTWESLRINLGSLLRGRDVMAYPRKVWSQRRQVSLCVLARTQSPSQASPVSHFIKTQGYPQMFDGLPKI